jgi:membrane-associated phospholipid phosphatase
MVADEFRESISIIFGRDWPETWVDNNPSLISNNAYGFHWFQGTRIDDSFPSGHMARTVGASAVFWAMYRSTLVRTVAAAICLTMAISLIGMNYHFVSDVIAGSFLGAIVGSYGAMLAGVGGANSASNMPRPPRP